MPDSPLRLLISGYALAALAATGLALAGGGLVAALLTFWLGGAAAVLSLGALPGSATAFRKARRPAREAADDPVPDAATLAVDLAQWDADRLADMAEGRARRDAQARRNSFRA